jgi:hypothetical protein
MKKKKRVNYQARKNAAKRTRRKFYRFLTNVSVKAESGGKEKRVGKEKDNTLIFVLARVVLLNTYA